LAQLVENYKTNEPFDFIVLARSPSYTPKKSDELIPLIKEYMSVAPK